MSYCICMYCMVLGIEYYIVLYVGIVEYQWHVAQSSARSSKPSPISDPL